mmetsp:Transcript_8789/g.16399  ORF Transcript_8789/g.16399 Transcript_8789/m.16399 type:complete len:2007 (+) Transcript_8789:453-6473(+)|eukprot:CAMPEP_0203762836 /NCGR_PEP_ID=MMETSP0098-20131031/15631_1 /ASSEMBLY_ACC=CAM_ASM_000208 /TAXON_ID=96639 /ORGANISM=" , Strain NY0313808BC1" /LENGTH=2006 /DNA_ID=CAMNT_0050657399 /DNA_START=402 /DNA_END=6425 /DNA_ORIENTATION=-
MAGKDEVGKNGRRRGNQKSQGRASDLGFIPEHVEVNSGIDDDGEDVDESALPERILYGAKINTGKGQGRLFGSVRTTATGRATHRNNGGDIYATGQERGTDRSSGSSAFSTRESAASTGSLEHQVSLDVDSCCEYLQELKTDLALQLEINKLDLLASLVSSRIIRYHMENLSSRTKQQVFSSRFDAAVLFADISGFSNLAERLVKEMKHVAYAAENLSRYIGASLEKMVAKICNKGGDVIKFAGDAILAVFPTSAFDGDLRKATLCCSKVALSLSKYDFRVSGSSANDEDESGDKTVRLSVHCGVGCGTLVGYHVGGLNDRWEYFITGKPVDQISSCEPEAESGQTVVSRETLELCGESIGGTVLESGNLLLSEVKADFPNKKLIFAEMREYTSRDPTHYKTLQGLLRCYVPSPALVSIDSGNGIWSGELRICSTMFCKLTGLNYDGGDSALDVIQEAFTIVHKHILLYEGTLLRFIVDDKGAGVLAAFGLPPLKHENDAVRATKAAMNIKDEFDAAKLSKNNWNVGCSIGITTGEVFCGTVGGNLRCEYTLHGVKVNLAARLMVAAKSGVLCDRQTYRDSKTFVSYEKPKAIQVKGKSSKTFVYRPEYQKLIIPMEKKEQARQVGRRKEEACVKRLLRHVLDNTNPKGGVLVVTGEAGIGKTRLCQYAHKKCQNRPLIPLVARGDDTEKYTPFFIWRSLLTQVLQAFCPNKALEDMNDPERVSLLADHLPSSDINMFSDGTGDENVEDDRRTSSVDTEPSELDSNLFYAGKREDYEKVRKFQPLVQLVLADYFDNLDRIVVPRSRESDIGMGGETTHSSKKQEADIGMAKIVRVIVDVIAKARTDLENNFTQSGSFESTARRRLVFIVEDLQWADEYSMEVLFRIGELRMPVALILTCRESDIYGSDSSREGISNISRSQTDLRAMSETYEHLCGLSATKKCELKLLNQPEIQECMKSWLGATRVPVVVAQLVYSKSQGHPLFAEELCKLMLEDDVFVYSEDGVVGLSQEAQSDDFGLPSTISALMTSRLDRIPASLQLTLKVAAVIGTEFRMHVLAFVLLSYTGIEDETENIVSPVSPKPKQRSKGLGQSRHSSYNHEMVVRALQDETLEKNSNDSTNLSTQNGPAAAAAGDLREISKLLDENLSNLVERGFLCIESQSNGEQLIRFSSVMLRESAYSLLLFKMRKSLHIKVAQFYEEKYQDYLQPVYVLLANHYFAAESNEKAFYYLEIAGDDALEIHSMQQVWVCFTRLLVMHEQSKTNTTSIWKRASWYRKVGESLMYFGRPEAAEGYLQRALDLLGLNVTDTYYKKNDGGEEEGLETRLSKLHKRSQKSMSADLLKEDSDVQPGLAEADSAGHDDEWDDVSLSTKQVPVVKLNTQSNATALSRAIHNRGVYQSKFVRNPTMRRVHSSDKRDIADRHLSRGEGGNKKWYKRLFMWKGKDGESRVQKSQETMKKVEETKKFREIEEDLGSNVETFLEASRIYELLGSLVLNQVSELGLERRLNSITLASAAYSCSLRRPVREERNGDSSTNLKNVVLDLDDHKDEVRIVSPQDASRDQLAACFSSAALFYAGLSSEWSKEEANKYMEKTVEIFSQIRSSGVKGKASLCLGEYFLLLGEFEQSEHYLKRATWIYNFLGFQRDKLCSIEMHVALELFAGMSMRPVLRLSRDIYQEGSGMFCVNTLCAFIAVRASDYARSQVFLEQVLEMSIDSLRAGCVYHTAAEVEEVCVRILSQVGVDADGQLNALVAFSLLLARRFDKIVMALHVAKTAAELATSSQSYDSRTLPVVSFQPLVFIFQVFQESFTSFVDLEATKTQDNPGSRRNHLESRASSFGESTMKYYALNNSLSKTFGKSEAKPNTQTGFDDLSIDVLSEVEQKAYTIGQARVIRKASLSCLKDLLATIKKYGDMYPACKPYGAYCEAVFICVKSGRLHPKSAPVFQRCAEEAQQHCLQHLKCSALLELAIIREDTSLFKNLAPLFKRQMASFEEHKCSFLEKRFSSD